MREITTFTDAKNELASFYDLGKPRVRTYTLDAMRQLLLILGDPQNNLRVIHVAGTSGKTSTAYYAAALAQGSGLKVGLTVSPHVIEINDRVQINGTPLPQALFCSELQEFLGIVRANQLRPSYFELMMAFAFWEFNRQNVDCAVIEVGLGGTLDASNTIDREDKVCVITDIGLDHTQVLGNTYAEIAAQKAGIIGFKNNIFCYHQRPEVMSVFRTQAQIKQADLHVLSANDRAPEAKKLSLFQQRNFTLALAAVKYLCGTLNRQLLPKALDQALAITVPGRMETKVVSGKTIIIDGAHNQQKIATLMESIAAAYPGKRIAALVAFGQQQEANQRMHEGLKELQPFVDTIIATTFSSAQDAPHDGVSPHEIADIARDLAIPTVLTEADPGKAYGQLLQQPQPIYLVVGSFYLLNDIRPRLYPRS